MKSTYITNYYFDYDFNISNDKHINGEYIQHFKAGLQ